MIYVQKSQENSRFLVFALFLSSLDHSVVPTSNGLSEHPFNKAEKAKAVKKGLRWPFL